MADRRKSSKPKAKAKTRPKARPKASAKRASRAKPAARAKARTPAKPVTSARTGAQDAGGVVYSDVRRDAAMRRLLRSA
jgi:hypothetical protein